MANLCPVCGFDLGFPPWQDDSPSDEICPCCLIQFGYDDAAGGDLKQRSKIYDLWREKWRKEGMKWRGASHPPQGWDGIAQLRKAGIA